MLQETNVKLSNNQMEASDAQVANFIQSCPVVVLEQLEQPAARQAAWNTVTPEEARPPCTCAAATTITAAAAGSDATIEREIP